MAADPFQSVIGGGLLDDRMDLVASEWVVLDPVAPVDGDEVAGSVHGQAGQLVAVFCSSALRGSPARACWRAAAELSMARTIASFLFRPTRLFPTTTLIKPRSERAAVRGTL